MMQFSIKHQNKARWHNESVRAYGGPTETRAPTVPMAEYFPIELGFCITVRKAQGRTTPRVIVSLSEHPNYFLKFKWEQLYALAS